MKKREKFLIIVAGSPATGKSYFIKEIKKIVPDLFILAPDEVKECLADSRGFSNLEEKEELEKKVWQFYYTVLTSYMQIGYQTILTEYPFSSKQQNKLQELVEQYDYKVITIRLVADFEFLWERRKRRDQESSRHLSHIMTQYHYGDILDDRSQADNHISKEAFAKIIEDRGYNKFELGNLYEVDVTQIDPQTYTDLVNKINAETLADLKK